MGKAKERREKSRKKYLADLAGRDPEKFDAEWHKRMDSWLGEISQRTLSMVDSKGRTRPAAFDVVDAARRALEKEGVIEQAIEAHNSIDMLTHACTSAVASLHGRGLYHLNVIMERRERHNRHLHI